MAQVPALSRKFEWSPAPQTTVALELASGDVDAIQALLSETAPFPDRELQIGSVKLAASGEVKVPVGAALLTIGGSGQARTALAVLEDGARIVDALALKNVDQVGIEFPAGKRRLLVLAGYEAMGELSGSHPIGGVGAVTFGVEGQRDRTLAMVHEFEDAEPARAVVARALSAFRLPRFIDAEELLPAGSTLISEADGSLAFRIGAQLGYSFNFVREVENFGLKGDIGLKIDAGLKTTLGLNVSGRYLVVLSRADESPQLRLQLFKLSKKGWNFGLDLSAALAGTATALPDESDDFVKAVFGVHGLQVLKDIEKTVNSDLSDTAAGLTVDAMKDLVRKVTGLTPETAIERGFDLLRGALEKWDSLPERVSAELWKILDKAEDATKDRLLSDLQAVADPNAGVRRQNIAALIAIAGFDSTPIGRLITAVSERGVLALLEDSTELRDSASRIIELLNGNEIPRLQSEISGRLRLDALKEVRSFDALDEWLKGRLSQFVDGIPAARKLDEARKALAAVMAMRQEVYAKARQAIARRYDFKFAYAYQTATSKTALIDATFDMLHPAAASIFREVVADANYDRLMTEPTAGVTLRSAVLTHELSKSETVEVTLPYYNSKRESLTTSLASVRAEQEGGRVLFYELKASNKEAVRNRFKSQLAVAANIPIEVEGVRRHSLSGLSWAYKYQFARDNIRRTELEYQLRPFIDLYFSRHFPTGTSSGFPAWMTDLDTRVGQAVQNGSDEFGDVLLSVEVAAPAAALGAWFRTRDNRSALTAAKDISHRVQRILKQMIPHYYLFDLDRVEQNTVCAPLLVYAAIPTCTAMRVSGETITFNEGDDVYWDCDLAVNRGQMVHLEKTKMALAKSLALYEERLRAAGRKGQADRFHPDELKDFMTSSQWQTELGNLHALLRLERRICLGIRDALADVQEFSAEAARQPARAIERLAEFGEEVTETWNKDLSGRYGPEVSRPLGAMMFLEASRVLDPTLADDESVALLDVTVLHEQRSFKTQDYLDGKIPEQKDIAVAERLLSMQ